MNGLVSVWAHACEELPSLDIGAYLDDKSLSAACTSQLEDAIVCTQEFDELTDQQRNLSKQTAWSTAAGSLTNCRVIMGRFLLGRLT